MKRFFAYIILAVILFLKFPGEYYHSLTHHTDHAIHDESGVELEKAECGQCLFFSNNAVEPCAGIDIALNDFFKTEYTFLKSTIIVEDKFYFPVRGSPVC